MIPIPTLKHCPVCARPRVDFMLLCWKCWHALTTPQRATLLSQDHTAKVLLITALIHNHSDNAAANPS